MAEKIKIYQYGKCSTCRKALKFLDAKKVKYISVDITEVAPTKTELKEMLKHVDGNIKKLFNTSGVVYREMKISDKLKAISEKEAIALLASNGRLVKRPFILNKNSGFVGFKEEEWEKAF